MAQQFHVGQRLSYSKALCTVRYIGSVEGTQGEWLGVEWDHVQRGKHSGEHEGRRYFEWSALTFHGYTAGLIPKAGTFIRPSRAPDPSLSFLEALREKYANPEDPLKHHAISISASKVIEEVGFDKTAKKFAHLQDLKIVLLDTWAIDRADDADLIRQICPNIEELDVSRNRFEKLEDIAKICAGLPRLKSLRISGNRFSSLDIADSTPFKVITSLEINNIIQSWAEITHLLSYFPSVKQLLMQHNNLSDFPNPAPFPATLKALDLSHNLFSSLATLPPLAPLTHLETLILSHNPVSSLSVVPTERPTSTTHITFPSLTRLDISYVAIPDFPELDNLFHPPYFPSLTSIRVSHSPLYSNIPWEEAHMLTISRLPSHVKSLNQSTITTKERENAEMWYLSRIAKELSETDGSEHAKAGILSKHLRWNELCELHGTPMTAATMATNDRTLSARLLHLEFVSPEKTITKKLPKSTAVSTVRGLVGRWYGISPLKVKLRVEGDAERGTETVTLGEDEGIREIGMWIEHGAARVVVEGL